MTKQDAFEVALKLLGVYAAWRSVLYAVYLVGRYLTPPPEGVTVTGPYLQWENLVAYALLAVVLVGAARQAAKWLAGREQETSAASVFPPTRLGFWIALLGVFFLAQQWPAAVGVARGFRFHLNPMVLVSIAFSGGVGFALIFWGHRIGAWIERRWARQAGGPDAAQGAP